MRDVFISYGGPDEEFAAELCQRLRSAGIDAFFFPDSAEYGMRLHNVMRDGIHQARLAVLICSKNSLNRNGVANEIEEGLSREAEEGGRSFIIPIAIDDYVFEEWKPNNSGLAKAIRQRVIGDFRHAKKDSHIFDANLARLLRIIMKERGDKEQNAVEIFNFNPESCKPDKDFGVSEWSRLPGRMSLIKWRDPGGPGYGPDYPYDRPNRVLTVDRMAKGKRQWREYNLSRVENGSNVWDGPTHHWVEAEHDFAAIGNNRPGSVFFRKDLGGFRAEEDRVAILEFFVTKDSIKLIRSGLKAFIYMRWTSDQVGTTLETRELQIGLVGFRQTDFEISEIVFD